MSRNTPAPRCAQKKLQLEGAAKLQLRPRRSRTRSASGRRRGSRPVTPRRAPAPRRRAIVFSLRLASTSPLTPPRRVRSAPSRRAPGSALRARRRGRSAPRPVGPTCGAARSRGVLPRQAAFVLLSCSSAVFTVALRGQGPRGCRREAAPRAKTRPGTFELMAEFNIVQNRVRTNDPAADTRARRAPTTVVLLSARRCAAPPLHAC